MPNSSRGVCAAAVEAREMHRPSTATSVERWRFREPAARAERIRGEPRERSEATAALAEVAGEEKETAPGAPAAASRS